MNGKGQLWADLDGLPLRQVIDLEVPELPNENDAIICLVVDYGFGAWHGRLDRSDILALGDRDCRIL